MEENEQGSKYLILQSALESIVDQTNESLGYNYVKCVYCGVSAAITKQNTINHRSNCPALIAYNALDKVKKPITDNI